MSNRIIFGSKHSGETVSEVFDFTSRLALGETISSATVTAAVYSGSDSSPSALISGSASISAGKVTQKVTGGTLGVTYTLTCTAITSASQTLQLVGFLAIVPAAN